MQPGMTMQLPLLWQGGWLIYAGNAAWRASSNPWMFQHTRLGEYLGGGVLL